MKLAMFWDSRKCNSQRDIISEELQSREVRVDDHGYDISNIERIAEWNGSRGEVIFVKIAFA